MHNLSQGVEYLVNIDYLSLSVKEDEITTIKHQVWSIYFNTDYIALVNLGRKEWVMKWHVSSKPDLY